MVHHGNDIRMTSNAIVQKLWNYCKILRDDGLSYRDYIEQLTFLLFLKMADERQKLFPERTILIPSTGKVLNGSMTTTWTRITGTSRSSWARSPACWAPSSAKRRTTSGTLPS